MQSNQTSQSRPGGRTTAVGSLGAAVVAAVIGLVWYATSSGTRVYAVKSDSYPGLPTAAAEPIGYFLATLAGAVCLGALLYVVTMADPDPQGVIDEYTFIPHVVVERAALVWTFTAAVMVAVQAASDCGVSMWQLVSSTAVGDAIGASEMSRAWIAVALAGLIVAITARISLRWVSHAVLMIPASVGVVALPVSGNAGQGPDHDYATSAAIVFATMFAAWAGLKITALLNPPQPRLARRLLAMEALCGGVSVGYGVILLAILMGTHDVGSSAYGRAAVVASVVLVAVWGRDVALLISGRPDRHAGLRTVLGALAAVGLVGLIASMATQTPPRLQHHQFSTWDIFLGYRLPRPPSVATILTVWRFDTFLGAGAIVLVLLYAAGYVRLRRRGDAWPVGRLISWVCGCLSLLFTSSSGVKAYGSAMFSVHMGDHMAQNMFIPVLLVLGGPVTLALRALHPAAHGEPPGPREWVLWLVHSKFTAFLSNPVTAFVFFVGSLYVVYFTPLFDTLVRYHWGHELMSLHFILVGYLFFWGIIGIDPGPRRLPFLGRLGLLFAVMPFHAFYGIATMTMTSTIGHQFYSFVGLPWLADLSADQHLGGAIAWGSSELPVILVVIALVTQWARDDRRTATREDRRADQHYGEDELDAYNAMLRELANERHH